MPDLDEPDTVLPCPQCLDDAVYAVARQTEDAVDAPGDESLDENVGCILRHGGPRDDLEIGSLSRARSHGSGLPDKMTPSPGARGGRPVCGATPNRPLKGIGAGTGWKAAGRSIPRLRRPRHCRSAPRSGLHWRGSPARSPAPRPDVA